MRIPYEKRVDRYIIKWENVDGEKPFRYGVITIEELWGLGHLKFKNPLVIEVFFGQNDGTERTDALCVYDFGMEQRIPTEKENNWLYDYACTNAKCEPIKTVFATIKFDLMHAFFHYRGDPNYGAVHWALTGHLNDRVVAHDPIEEDCQYDEEQQKKKELL